MQRTAKTVLDRVEAEASPQLFAEDLEEGMVHRMVVFVTGKMIISFAEITGDHNIFHVRGKHRCFAHGRLLGDLAAAVISNWLGSTKNGFPVLRNDTTNYIGMVPAGSSFKITVSISALLHHNAKRSTAMFNVTGVCDGKAVFTGTGSVFVPRRNRG